MENMEGVMAIGVGYVFMLTPAIIVFLVLRAQQNSLEKRLDALVQMSRISGEVVGADEISHSLISRENEGRLRRWGVILLTTAVGGCAAGVFAGVEPLLVASVIVGALGLGLLLADRFSASTNEDEPDAAASQVAP